LTSEGPTPLNGISINGVDGTGLTASGSTEPKNVVGYGGELHATAQFFGTADKNAGPIVNVIVNWGDGRPFSGNNPGRYKNHLGMCSADDARAHAITSSSNACKEGTSECDNSDFAHSTGACTEDYFYYTHTYTCNRENLPGPCIDVNNPGSAGCFAENTCPEDVNGGMDGNGSCCVFKPRVQLKDNWGWCNGDCGSGTSKGCYAEECESGIGKDPWTYFTGKVIVVPK
jgi:hypothetical protein